MTEGTSRLRAGLVRFYGRHRRTFWVLHSLWALATGGVVVLLAHTAYSYAAWVLVFLVLTWLSTLLFTRAARPEERSGARRWHGVASYLTRVMYQETLFFLLPFYFYSTTLDSTNVLFLALLALLAVMACLDLLFDELLRRHAWFGIFFFTIVSLAALNFLLPLALGLRIESAIVAAAVIGLLAAIPMAGSPQGGWRWRAATLRVLPALVTVGFLVWLRVLVPPVPLRLEGFTFARDVRSATLEPIEPLAREAALAGGQERLAVVATVFAPRRVRVRVVVQWWRDGELLKTSRDLDITPHEAGFKVWDAFSPNEGPLVAGDYRVILRTVGGQLIGRANLRLTASASRSAPGTGTGEGTGAGTGAMRLGRRGARGDPQALLGG